MSDKTLKREAEKGSIKCGFNTEDVALAQLADIKNNVLYTFGKDTIEIDFVVIDEVPCDFPFFKKNT
jgi:hypothetical protein